MFSYCGNNPVNHCDPTGKAFIGIGVQLDITVGNYECGIEIIVYWDETVSGGDGLVVAVYVYEGISASINADLLKSTDLNNLISQLTLAVFANAGTDFDTLALINLQAALFGSEASGSVVGIWGYDNFQSTADYAGPFTSYSGYIHHVKGTFSYSNTCWSVAVGATTGNGWSLSFGQTNYTEVYSSAWANAGGGRIARKKSTSSDSGFSYCI